MFTKEQTVKAFEDMGIRVFPPKGDSKQPSVVVDIEGKSHFMNRKALLKEVDGVEKEIWVWRVGDEMQPRTEEVTA